MHRRGYRFIAQVQGLESKVQSQDEEEKQKAKDKKQQLKIEGVPPALPLVGRDPELTQLHQLLEKAQYGERQLVFVTGEPGIGKTSLLDACVAGVQDRKESQNAKTCPERSRRIKSDRPPTPGLPRGNALSSTERGKGSCRSSMPSVACVGGQMESTL